MPPIVGITTSKRRNEHGQAIVELTQAYAAAVLQAGGIPVLLPSVLGQEDEWEALYFHLDGILFAGGGDIAPERFAGPAHASLTDIDIERDTLELALLKASISDGKPFLGICRGCQLVNVGYGGTLYTHLPDQLAGAIEHDRPAGQRSVLAHQVNVELDTKLGSVLGAPEISVNSHHHQGIRDIGLGLRVAGRAPDGLPEAVEAAQHPFGMAVQWHPEWLMDQPHALHLFGRFVDAAAAH